MAQIEDLLRQFPDDKRHVRFSFDHRGDGYVVRAMLTLPTGHLVAQTAAPVPDAGAAVDQVVERLAAELRQHRGVEAGNGENGGDGNRVAARGRRRGRDFAAVRQHLSSSRRTDDHDGFFDILRPLLRQLRSHARRELVIAQLEGAISPGELDVGDLLDEVLRRAWDRWPDGPRDQPLDRWLVGLLHRVLDGMGVEHSPREGRPSQGNNSKAPHAVENGWAVENSPYWPYVDSLTRDDVLPGDGPPDGVLFLTAEQQRRAILVELSRFSRHARRAFALHALEGWSLEELAVSQDRPRAYVIADVDAVRHALRRRLPPADA